MQRCLSEDGNIGSFNQLTVNWLPLHKSLTHYDAHLAMLKNNLKNTLESC